jgi:hypothetical protein
MSEYSAVRANEAARSLNTGDAQGAANALRDVFLRDPREAIQVINNADAIARRNAAGGPTDVIALDQHNCAKLIRPDGSQYAIDPLPVLGASCYGPRIADQQVASPPPPEAVIVPQVVRPYYAPGLDLRIGGRREGARLDLRLP